MLSSLEEMPSVDSDYATRVNGLLDRYQKDKTVLGLLVAPEVLGELECLKGYCKSNPKQLKAHRLLSSMLVQHFTKRGVKKSLKKCLRRQCQ